MNKGFTLIELLVVVLIIGILAAIALPQYTKAVERSRMSEAVQMLGDLATAQSIYYMQNNHFANSLDVLNSSGDVQIPTLSSNGAWSLIETGFSAGSMVMQRSNGMYSAVQLSLKVDEDGTIHKSCAANGAAKGGEFCIMANTMGYPAGSAS